MKSEFAQKLDRIEAYVGSKLHPLGFRQSGLHFNRRQPDGIVHVIDFQMAPNWTNLWGKFTIELGAFIPEVHQILTETAVPRSIGTPYCDERVRLGELITGRDQWWDLTKDETELSNEIAKLLVNQDDKYFKQIDSREMLINFWNNKKRQESTFARKVLIMAIMMAQNGEKTRAEDLLRSEFPGRSKTGFLHYARNVCILIGLEFPPFE
jgi:hypothetical protein